MVNRSPLTAFAASVPSLPSPPLTAAFSNERGGRSNPPCNYVKKCIVVVVRQHMVNYCVRLNVTAVTLNLMPVLKLDRVGR
jgi:hypothetical protein